MDKRRGMKNIIVSIAFKIVLLVGSILVRRFLIQYIGNDANGLSSLYMSIIGFLTVAELGVGEAITFCMYKPIVNGEDEKVSALYCLFKKMYTIIGVLIFAAGLIVLPFLPRLAKDYSEIDVNVYITFFLTLISVVMTYAYSAKTSLINAYKNNYIVTTITSGGTLIEDTLKIATIILTKSFEAYLCCRIVAVALQWVASSFYVNNHYKQIVTVKAKVDKESKTSIIKNIKAMFMHKIGNVLVNTADSVIISAFIGVVILGKYSNYTTIMLSMTGVLSLFFYPLISVVGHAFVRSSKKEMEEYFFFFYGINYILGTIFCLGYYAVIDNVILLCFGKNLELSQSIVFVITLDYYIQFMRTSTLMFRSSTGTFYNDRWKPLFEGSLNVILSVALVKSIGITGVIIATIITALTICDTIEPYVVFKHGLNKKPTKFYLMNYAYIAVFVGSMFAVGSLKVVNDSVMVEFLINGLIAVGIGIIPCAIMVITNSDFRKMASRSIKSMNSRQIKG